MLLLLHIICYVTTTVTSDRVVMTNSGAIRGVTVSSTPDMDVEAFLSIPYAEPPVGELRFAKPVPKKPWSDIYEANRQLPTCTQNSSKRYFEPSLDDMREDCLYLNLWVPYTKRTKRLKPIVIFSHGGAFNLGSGNMFVYDGSKFSRFGDVIVATLNYRLGSLGFFSAFVPEANGNMGIFDQVVAAKWIQANARSFGGDPDHIVPMGESAGSMMVGGLLTSPLLKNLFKRVIMHSGAPTIPILLDDNERLYNVSQRLATMVGCADKTVTLKDHPKVVVDCLKRLPAQKLTDAEGVLIKNNPVTFFPRTGDEFLPKPIMQLLREGEFWDKEMLIGVNEMEGSFFLTVAAPDYFGVFGKNRANALSKRLSNYLIRFIFKFTEQRNEKEIADHYINSIRGEANADSYSEAISRSLGDYLINCASYFHAEYHSMRNPVYFYVFTKRPEARYNAPWMKTTHFDELQYVFGNPLFGNFSAEEALFSERMMARWVNFIYTGNPNLPGHLKWPQFTREDPEYLELNDQEAVRLRPDNNRCEFWRKRYQADFDNKILSKLKRSVNGGMTATASKVIVLLLSVLAVLSVRELP